MVLGIDIHPVYQEHINWSSLDKNVRFIWLKVSDGGSAYRKNVDGRIYTPDSHAAGMRSTGAACGGYHYAQFSPSPETQADVLTQEVRRLGLTSLAPALDIEAPFTPNAIAKDFAFRFMKRLKANGFAQVAIYSYTSMAQYLRPDNWDIPGLITWIARPGPVGQLGSYVGRTDVHQYTSAARISGIQESIDANQTLNDNLLGGEEQDMNIDDDVFITYPGNRSDGITVKVRQLLGDPYIFWADALKSNTQFSLVDIKRDVAELKAAQQIDYAKLARAIVDIAAERGIIGLSAETFKASLDSIRITTDNPAS